MTKENIPCKWCSAPTNFFGTKECNRCWELRNRIEADPALAIKFLKRAVKNISITLNKL